MLTAQPPFVKKDVMALLLAVTTETPPPVSHFRTGVSKEVEWILERCLEKKPQNRYPSTRALQQDLERLLKRGTRVRRSSQAGAPLSPIFYPLPANGNNVCLPACGSGGKLGDKRA